jgi:NADH:ubiquinone oxidoreductase subunit K
LEKKGGATAIRLMMPVGIILLMLGLFLFFAGILQCITSRKFLGYLFGLEMILNASSINLAGFISLQPERSELQVYIMMITALAAIEAAVGLALMVWAGRKETEVPFSLI